MKIKEPTLEDLKKIHDKLYYSGRAFNVITTMELNDLLDLIKSNKTRIKNHDEIINTYMKVMTKENFILVFFKDILGIRKKNYIKFLDLLNEANLHSLSFETLANFRKEFDILINKDARVKIKER